MDLETGLSPKEQRLARDTRKNLALVDERRMRGLIDRAKAGTFLPELGLRIASERQQTQKSAGQRHAREAEQRRQEIERATPAYQARVRVEREKLSQLRDDMKQRLAAGRPP